MYINVNKQLEVLIFLSEPGIRYIILLEEVEREHQVKDGYLAGGARAQYHPKRRGLLDRWFQCYTRDVALKKNKRWKNKIMQLKIWKHF